jgi:hypothetical protein
MNLGEIIAPRVLNPRELAQHELYLKFAQLCAAEQASTEMIAGAAVNLLITVVHRMHVKPGDAQARWDDLFGQGKELLRSRFKPTRSGG